MRTFLVALIGLIFSSALYGQTRPTAKFEATNKKARQAFEKVMPSQRFTVSWSKDNDGWRVRLESNGKDIVNGSLRDGEFAISNEDTKELKWERSTPERPGQIIRYRNLSKKNGDIEITRISDSVIEVAGEKAETEKGWVWGEPKRFSPEGNFVMVDKIRDVQPRQVQYVRSSPPKRLQPEHFTKTYVKPGDVLRTTVPVVFNKQGERLEIDPDQIADSFSIGKVHWHSDHQLWFEYIERGFGKFRLLELDAKTGQTRVIAEETSSKFVHAYEKCDWWPLADKQLLWRSEADGWSHLYTVDQSTGKRKQLTRGKWVIRSVDRIDGDLVYIKVGGYYPEQDPYYLHYAHVNWKTGKLTMLTEADGYHRASWSPNGKYFVDSFSRVDSPPEHQLRSAEDGHLIEVLTENSEEDLQAIAGYVPECFVTTDREGKYDIHGVIWKPRDFDPSQKYPVIEKIYAGPHGAFVPKEWKTWYRDKSEFAEAGFVVVQIDGRGTNYRGREFQHYAYKNLKDSGFPDRIKWMQAAGKTRPWMDLERVGIYGGSAGGQSAMAALLWHGDFYKAAAADCGCHDNRMDKIWWNEQWMDWPVDDSYVANSNVEHVSRLQGKLFLTVGEVDTNVDPSSTYQVVDALIRADKDFEYYAVPNGGHSIGGMSYLRRKRQEFFQRWLQTQQQATAE